MGVIINPTIEAPTNRLPAFANLPAQAGASADSVDRADTLSEKIKRASFANLCPGGSPSLKLRRVKEFGWNRGVPAYAISLR